MQSRRQFLETSVWAATDIGLYRDAYRRELPTRLLQQMRAEP